MQRSSRRYLSLHGRKEDDSSVLVDLQSPIEPDVILRLEKLRRLCGLRFPGAVEVMKKAEGRFRGVERTKSSV